MMINTVSICVFIAGIAVVFIVIFLLSNSTNIILASRESIVSDFFTYVNSTFGMKMQVPSNWDLQEIENELNRPAVTIIRVTPAFDIHKSFDTDPSDGSTYLDINVQNNSGNMSLDSLMKNNINIIKNDNNTSNSSYIIDLGQNMPICSLGLKFRNGDKVVNHFNIQTSLDGNHFSKPIFYDNTAAVSGEESYDISSDFPVTTRYVKINFDGNTQGDVYAPMQVRVLGNS